MWDRGRGRGESGQKCYPSPTGVTLAIRAYLRSMCVWKDGSDGSGKNRDSSHAGT